MTNTLDMSFVDAARRKIKPDEELFADFIISQEDAETLMRGLTHILDGDELAQELHADLSGVVDHMKLRTPRKRGKRGKNDAPKSG